MSLSKVIGQLLVSQQTSAIESGRHKSVALTFANLILNAQSRERVKGASPSIQPSCLKQVMNAYFVGRVPVEVGGGQNCGTAQTNLRRAARRAASDGWVARSDADVRPGDNAMARYSWFHERTQKQVAGG